MRESDRLAGALVTPDRTTWPDRAAAVRLRLTAISDSSSPARLVSLVGTWMQQVAQGWLVLTLTGDPFWLGVVATAQFLPVMVLGLFAGILADVLPKRQTLIVVQAVMMSLAIILAVLTAAGVVQIWMIIVLALLLGCANAVDMPVRQAFAIEMVGPQRHRQCGRHQLRDVQRRARRRAGAGGSDDRARSGSRRPSRSTR